eukprot:jgi/Mesvir1/12762/Mv24206-RA.1
MHPSRITLRRSESLFDLSFIGRKLPFFGDCLGRVCVYSTRSQKSKRESICDSCKPVTAVPMASRQSDEDHKGFGFRTTPITCQIRRGFASLWNLQCILRPHDLERSYITIARPRISGTADPKLSRAHLDEAAEYRSSAPDKPAPGQPAGIRIFVQEHPSSEDPSNMMRIHDHNMDAAALRTAAHAPCTAHDGRAWLQDPSATRLQGEDELRRQQQLSSTADRRQTGAGEPRSSPALLPQESAAFPDAVTRGSALPYPVNGYQAGTSGMDAPYAGYDGHNLDGHSAAVALPAAHRMLFEQDSSKRLAETGIPPGADPSGYNGYEARDASFHAGGVPSIPSHPAWHVSLPPSGMPYATRPPAGPGPMWENPDFDRSRMDPSVRSMYDASHPYAMPHGVYGQLPPYSTPYLDGAPPKDTWPAPGTPATPAAAPAPTNSSGRPPSSRNKGGSRMVWTAGLHNHFFKVVQKLGIDLATPLAILQEMNVPDLTRKQVASHFQKFRRKLRNIEKAKRAAAEANNHKAESQPAAGNNKSVQLWVNWPVCTCMATFMQSHGRYAGNVYQQANYMPGLLLPTTHAQVVAGI